MRRSTRPVVRADEEEGADEEAYVRVHGSAVYFYSDVTRASVLKLMQCLREAHANSIRHASAVGPTPAVYLYIHSGGGDSFAGLSAYDHIALSGIPVVAVADGVVASAATFLYLAADVRLALAHAFVRIHQVSILGFEGKYADMVDEMQNTHTLMAQIEDLYVTRTTMTKERVRELLKTEVDMHAAQCVANGIAHDVVGEKRKKKQKRAQ